MNVFDVIVGDSPVQASGNLISPMAAPLCQMM